MIQQPIKNPYAYGAQMRFCVGPHSLSDTTILMNKNLVNDFTPVALEYWHASGMQPTAWKSGADDEPLYVWAMRSLD